MGKLAICLAGVALAACGDSTANHAPDAATPDAAIDSIKTGPRMFAELAHYTDALHAMLYLRGFVYAVHSSADSVEVFDAGTRTALPAIGVGHVPGDLATDGSRLLVANMTARDAGDDYLSIIDPATQSVVARATVSELVWGSDPDNYPWTNFPSNVTVVGSRAYVVFPTNAVPGLVPVDVAGSSPVEQTYQAAGSGPGNLAGIGNRLVITNIRAIANFDDDELRLQDLDGSNVNTIVVGGKLHDARVVGDRVWVARGPADGSAGDLLVVDPATDSVEHVATAPGAYGLATANGLVYVTCTGANRVQVFDAGTRALVEDIDLGTLAPTVINARGIAATPDGDIFLESDGLISALYR
jgi:hypothetical protein